MLTLAGELAAAKIAATMMPDIGRYFTETADCRRRLLAEFEGLRAIADMISMGPGHIRLPAIAVTAARHGALLLRPERRAAASRARPEVELSTHTLPRALGNEKRRRLLLPPP